MSFLSRICIVSSGPDLPDKEAAQQPITRPGHYRSHISLVAREATVILGAILQACGLFSLLLCHLLEMHTFHICVASSGDIQIIFPPSLPSSQSVSQSRRHGTPTPRSVSGGTPLSYPRFEPTGRPLADARRGHLPWLSSISKLLSPAPRWTWIGAAPNPRRFRRPDGRPSKDDSAQVGRLRSCPR